MQMKKIFVLITMLSIQIFAQVPAYHVEFHEMNGRLTKSDSYRSGFGRYHGYEIPAYSGEGMNFIVYSEKFTPSLVLVDPEGKIFKQKTASNTQFANFSALMNKEGTWILYVVGDSTAFGDFYFQYAIASPQSLELSADADFCTGLNYVLEHCRAFFVFFDNPVSSRKTFTKLNGSSDAFLDDDDGSYNAVFYDGDDLKKAESVFNDLTGRVKACLTESWNIKNNNWSNIEDYKEKSAMFTSKDKTDERFVKVVFQDLRTSDQKYENKFSVAVTINRSKNK